jgi:hypothetical protein
MNEYVPEMPIINNGESFTIPRIKNPKFRVGETCLVKELKDGQYPQFDRLMLVKITNMEPLPISCEAPTFYTVTFQCVERFFPDPVSSAAPDPAAD